MEEIQDEKKRLNEIKILEKGNLKKLYQSKFDSNI